MDLGVAEFHRHDGRGTLWRGHGGWKRRRMAGAWRWPRPAAAPYAGSRRRAAAAPGRPPADDLLSELQARAHRQPETAPTGGVVPPHPVLGGRDHRRREHHGRPQHPELGRHRYRFFASTCASTTSYIDVNDDCISIKSGKDADGLRVNRPAEDILIENSHFAYGHGGVAMGSETSGGIRNVEVAELRRPTPATGRPSASRPSPAAAAWWRTSPIAI